MRGIQAKRARKAAADVAHNHSESTFQDTFQAKIPMSNALLLDRENLPINVVPHENDLIFVQRRLDPYSLKRIVKLWKRTLNRLPGAARFEFSQYLVSVQS